MRIRYPIPVAVRLQALHRELNAQMKIRITEPVFFLGESRKIGDILEAPIGPYRTQIIPGGLSRIAQFVEMPEEIKQVIQEAAAQQTAPALQTSTVAAGGPSASSALPPASFAEATAAIIKPAAPASKPISKTAAMLSALAARRRKLEATIANEATAYAARLTEIETIVPAVFGKAKASLDDRQASLGEIDASLVELSNAGGSDPL